MNFAKDTTLVIGEGLLALLLKPKIQMQLYLIRYICKLN